MGIDYKSLLESAKTDKAKTKVYLEARENLLKNSKELLESKKTELKNATDYVYLLQTVVQGLEFAIQQTEKEIEGLRTQIEGSEVYENSLTEVQNKLATNRNKVATGNFKTEGPVNKKSAISSQEEVHKSLAQEKQSVLGQKLYKTEAKKPQIGIQLQSYAEAKKDAEKLSANNNLESAESAGIANGQVKLSDAGLVKTELSEVEQDKEYMQKVLTACKAPDDKDLKAIWMRRVMVKHYMETGMSSVKALVDRFNAYANADKVKTGSESSISKDMKRIVEGNFKLEVKKGRDLPKEVFTEFRPVLMLTSNEVCQLSGVIASMQKSYPGKTAYIKSYIEKYARTNMDNMNTYKIQAVKSYVAEQMAD